MVAISSISLGVCAARFAVLFVEAYDTDRSQFLLKTVVWTGVEGTAAQVASCLPALRVLVRQRRGRPRTAVVGYASGVYGNRSMASSAARSKTGGGGGKSGAHVMHSEIDDQRWGSQVELQDADMSCHHLANTIRVQRDFEVSSAI